MRRLLLLLTLILTLSRADGEMPADKRLVEGMLPNSFSYHIMHNEKPKGMVEFRLLVRAGSLEEEDDQQGLAHFIEHMAFNGTEHFQKNEMIAYLESIGMKFGGDLNANTNYTRTLYKLTVPVKGENVDKALTILRDWAGGITFDPVEFDKERGVVLEEKRLRNRAGFRLYKQYMPLFFEGSKYKDRLVIGKEKVLKTAPVSRAIDFYKKWYRPELMSLVVVGDIDVEAMRRKVAHYFGSLENSNHEMPISRLIPEHNTTRVMHLTDKELSSNSADIYFVERRFGTVSEADKRRDLVNWMTLLMFNLNAQKELLKPEHKALTMRMGDSALTPLKHTFDFSVTYKAGERMVAFGELAALMARFEKFGFSQRDLETVRKQLLALNENSYKEYNNIKSASFAGQIASNLLSGAVFVDEEYDHTVSKKILESIVLEEINKRFKEIVSNKDRIILFMDTEKHPVKKEEVLAFIEKARAEAKAPSKAEDAPMKLIEKPLPEKKIIKNDFDKETGIYHYTLENGVRVDFMPTELKRNQVLIAALSPGGDSIVPLDTLNDAKKAASWVIASAPGRFKTYELKELIAGKKLGYNFTIGRFWEGISANSSSEDLETVLQLIYLQTTQPKIDADVAKRQRRMLFSMVAEADRDPAYRFQKELLPWYFKHNPRIFFDSEESIAALDGKKMLKIFKEKFGDMNHFRFIIVGDTTPQKIEPLIARYLGNLPTGEKREQYDGTPFERLHGAQKFMRRYNTTNIANISLQYRSKMPYSLENMAAMDALKGILNIRLRNLIREEKSGTYGVRFDCAIKRELGDVTICSVDFAADPQRVDELVTSVKQVLSEFKREGPTTQELRNHKTEFSVQNRLMRKENGYWKRVMEESAKFGLPVSHYLKFPQAVEKLTSKDVRRAANVLISGDELLAERLPEKQ